MKHLSCAVANQFLQRSVLLPGSVSSKPQPYQAFYRIKPGLLSRFPVRGGGGGGGRVDSEASMTNFTTVIRKLH